MKIGYIRCSTEEQNTARQEALMQELGVEQLFIDKLSGKNTDRPQLKAMLRFARQGDTVIVSEISRLARNTKDLLDITAELADKGVEFVSRKEAIDTTTATGKFMLTVFAAVAELERSYILSRQAEGIAIAKAQGKYKGRSPKKLPPEAEKLIADWHSGKISAAETARRLGIGKTTFYRRFGKR